MAAIQDLELGALLSAGGLGRRTTGVKRASRWRVGWRGRLAGRWRQNARIGATDQRRQCIEQRSRVRVGRTVDQYYKFSMTLKDLRTGELVWADEQEIRKESVRPPLGF